MVRPSSQLLSLCAHGDGGRRASVIPSISKVDEVGLRTTRRDARRAAPGNWLATPPTLLLEFADAWVFWAIWELGFSLGFGLGDVFWV
ncbi:hypothetical protein J1N35_035424 [Gossypium stocksii]|uniref:Uncharacterized protein n=1 Tax=Gossypium stocksii TaxID=47602 RepID=A0A9D3UUR8_9ROSI|nr:hypothetical protein J1N35_035424 [Gossypium stocksii]